MRYLYAGPMPVTDDNGELLHPGDIREHASAPDCPPWQPIEEPQADPAPATEDKPPADEAKAPAAVKKTASAAKPEGM